MINISVDILDWDTGNIETVALPLSSLSSSLIDAEHELIISNWDGSCLLGEDDVIVLDKKIKTINEEVPSLTIELLELIWSVTDEFSLFDDHMVKKITTKDFMLDEVPYPPPFNDLLIDEYCAKYLLLNLNVPFAQNITKDEIKKISENPEKVDWSIVWAYYDFMGFKQLSFGKHLFVLHWGDSADNKQ